MSDPIHIPANQIEPFLDETLIEEIANLDFKLHEAVKREVVFAFDRPWEKRGSAFCTFLRDHEGRIRMYYRAEAAGGDFSDQQTCGVAFSDDGIHFERPNLGIVEHEGSKANNLIWKGIEAHNMAPFRDTNPDAEPEARYKATGGPIWKIYGLRSVDGIHWKKMSEDMLEHEGVFDSHNVTFWDTHLGCYRSFSRYFDGGWPTGIRAIQSATSADFIHWSKPQPHVYSHSVPLEQFYTNATMRYPGHSSLLLSFPMRYIIERKLVEGHPAGGVSDALFMTSRDGVHWERRFPEAWVRPGPDRRNWTDRSSVIAPGLMELDTAEWSLYISEHYRWDSSRIRRLAIRPHGFVSLHAGFAGGQFTTRPLILDGSRLHLNFSTSAAGSLQVELQDADGGLIPGFELDAMEPLYGDSIDQVVTWKQNPDISALSGHPVRLRFSLRDADIYSMKID